MPNLTKKPGRRELCERVCKLASLPPLEATQAVLGRRQLAELVLYLENTHNLLAQMKEKIQHGEASSEKEHAGV